MAFKELKKTGSTSKSPVSNAAIDTNQIKAVGEVLLRHDGQHKLAGFQYADSHIANAYGGRCSAKGLFRAIAGDSSLMYKEQMHSGNYRWGNVKLRERYDAPDNPLPLNRWKGLEDMTTFMAAKPAEQDKALKDWGII